MSISEGLSVAMQERLIAGRLDIALLYNPTPSPDFHLTPLRDEELVLFGPKPRGDRRAPAGSIALSEVAKLPLVTPSRPNAIRMLIETTMSGIGCRPHIALEIDGVEAILDLVSDGAGFAILPGYAVSASSRPNAYQMRRIVRPRLKSRLEIAMSSQRATTLTQQAMLALIHDVADKVFPKRAGTT